jgi:outer membrane murein-binding lipoprotein Lpp
MKWICIFVFACLLLGGCASEREIACEHKIGDLEAQKADLAAQVNHLEVERRDMRQQLKSLSGIRREAKLEKAEMVRRIKLGKSTGLSDKDKDGIAETLVVFLQPTDKMGDVLKAAGTAKVELWDLASARGVKLLDRSFPADELEGKWVKGFFTNGYRMVFDLGPEISKRGHDLTLRVAFTSYLTGRTYTTQKVIKN